MGVRVSRGTEAVAATQPESSVEKLAQIFPHASPVRIPVQVLASNGSARPVHEGTMIEFGTAHEVLFASTLPLEFENRIRLVNSDGSFDAQATVVAVRYHGGKKSVAARFLGDVPGWIIKQ